MATTATQLMDFGNPRVITGVAREVISGGQLVSASGIPGVVDGTVSSYAASDIKVYVNTTANDCIGVALTNAASGANVAIAVEGVFMVPCTGSIVAGGAVKALANGCANLGSFVVPANAEDSAAAGACVGRALTAGFSGTSNYAIVYFK